MKCGRALPVLATLLTSMAVTPFVQAETQPLKILFTAGVSFGGDELYKVKFTDGTTDEISAGSLLTLGMGADYRLPSSPYSFRTILEYQFDSVEATNGDMSFSKIAIDALAFYNFDIHSVGLGLTYNIDPELEVTCNYNCGSIPTGKLAMDSAAGFILEYNYNFNENANVGVRYTNISFDVESESVDGSNVGLFFNYLI